MKIMAATPVGYNQPAFGAAKWNVADALAQPLVDRINLGGKVQRAIAHAPEGTEILVFDAYSGNTAALDRCGKFTLPAGADKTFAVAVKAPDKKPIRLPAFWALADSGNRIDIRSDRKELTQALNSISKQ